MGQLKSMTDKDFRSIFDYLKTSKPVNNLVPASKPFCWAQIAGILMGEFTIPGKSFYKSPV